jgi:hypothetical protein
LIEPPILRRGTLGVLAKGKAFFTYPQGPAGHIHLVRLSSTSKGIATKQWTIRELPAQGFSPVVDPELDLLVVIETIANQ